jgi:hypothetical protein
MTQKKEIRIEQKELVEYCQEFGVKEAAKHLGVCARLIYYRLQGVDLGRKKGRCGRKKKLILT